MDFPRSSGAGLEKADCWIRRVWFFVQAGAVEGHLGEGGGLNGKVQTLGCKLDRKERKTRGTIKEVTE